MSCIMSYIPNNIPDNIPSKILSDIGLKQAASSNQICSYSNPLNSADCRRPDDD